MPEAASISVDPRVRRTRQLLQHALENLLETKNFDKISVQDIADAATVNRATFYDHYPDKFALLECLVAAQFHRLLAERKVCFDGSCASALRAIILGVCDYLAGRPGQSEPHMESAIIAVVRRTILDGLQQQPTGGISPEMVATTGSWAIYGAVKEWLRTPNRCSSEEIVDTVIILVTPIFGMVAHSEN
jgi:AcrR family transcriptional regulator